MLSLFLEVHAGTQRNGNFCVSGEILCWNRVNQEAEKENQVMLQSGSVQADRLKEEFVSLSENVHFSLLVWKRCVWLYITARTEA